MSTQIYPHAIWAHKSLYIKQRCEKSVILLPRTVLKGIFRDTILRCDISYFVQNSSCQIDFWKTSPGSCLNRLGVARMLGHVETRTGHWCMRVLRGQAIILLAYLLIPFGCFFASHGVLLRKVEGEILLHLPLSFDLLRIWPLTLWVGLFKWLRFADYIWLTDWAWNRFHFENNGWGISVLLAEFLQLFTWSTRQRHNFTTWCVIQMPITALSDRIVSRSTYV